MRWERIFTPEHEWVVVLAAAPALAFPRPQLWVTVVALAAVGAFWLGEWLTGRWRWLATPLTWSVLGLLVMIVAGWALSPVRDAGEAKLLGVVLGVLVFRAVPLAACTRRSLGWTLGLYLLAGAIVLTIGLAATTFVSKALLMHLTSKYLGRVVTLQGAEGGVNPNALGGTALFFLPLLVCLTLGKWRSPGRSVRHFLVSRAGLLCLLVWVTAVLFLSQSRTAWAAAFAAVAAAGMIQHRLLGRAGVGLLLALAASGLIWLSWANPHWVTAGTLTPRIQMWSKAITIIGEHPVVGIGVNAFRSVAGQRYPDLKLQAGVYFPQDLAHAHNIFLETALAAGLPGLVSYIAMLTIATMMCWRLVAGRDQWKGTVALGLWSSLVAVHGFGLIDAIPLGAKVGVFFWWNLGLIAAVSTLAHEQA